MLILIILIISSIWVYWDATRNKIGKILKQSGFFNLSAGLWALGVLMLWILVFPAYLIKRNNLIKIAQAHPTEASYRNFKLSILSVIGSIFILSSMATGIDQSNLATSAANTESNPDAINSLADIGINCNVRDARGETIGFYNTLVPKSIDINSDTICQIAQELADYNYTFTKTVLNEAFCNNMDKYAKQLGSYKNAIEKASKYSATDKNAQGVLKLLRICESEKSRKKHINESMQDSIIYSVGSFTINQQSCLGYLYQISSDSSSTYYSLKGTGTCKEFELNEESSNIFNLTNNIDGIPYGNYIKQKLNYDGELPSSFTIKGKEYTFFDNDRKPSTTKNFTEEVTAQKNDYAINYANSIKRNLKIGGHCGNFSNMIDQVAYSASSTEIKVKQIDRIIDSADRARCINY